MKFCIATITYWAEKGYNSSHWRKSIDGTRAMCHLEYGEILAKDLENNPNVQIYDVISDEFQALINSPEWIENGTDELIEDNSIASKVANLEEESLSTQIAIAEIFEATTGGGV